MSLPLLPASRSSGTIVALEVIPLVGPDSYKTRTIIPLANKYPSIYKHYSRQRA